VLQNPTNKQFWVPKKPEEKAAIDRFPSKKVPSRNPRKIWTLGNHQNVCGSCSLVRARKREVKGTEKKNGGIKSKINVQRSETQEEMGGWRDVRRKLGGGSRHRNKEGAKVPGRVPQGPRRRVRKVGPKSCQGGKVPRGKWQVGKESSNTDLV